MITKEEIEKRLKDIGFKDEELKIVFPDVLEIILNKTFQEYYFHLPLAVQEQLKNLSETEILKYIQDNKESLPKIADDSFIKNYNDTWVDYFKNVT